MKAVIWKMSPTGQKVSIILLGRVEVIANSSRKIEMEPKQKQHPVVDGTGERSKIQCCKEQYCIGTGMLGLSRQIGSGQTRDGKSECQHSRIQ